MFLFLLTLAVIALWIYQLVLSSRLQSDRDVRLIELDVLEADLNALRQRILHLEEAGKLPVAPSPAPAKAAPPAVLRAEPEPPPARPNIYEQPAEAPAAGQGWEAALGGSWLNKIGVLVLVIGLVLFIGYSFSMLGPAGRVAVAVAVSAAMLAGGAILERYEKYRVAARGLLGGGWAALYATTYAAHAIDAARVISSPALGTVLLSAVALGMVLHSLRYRSQVVTGVAYFAAFVTLAITQLTFFAVVALIPLAASMLYLAHRFRWTGVALAGLPCVYGLYLLQAARSSGGSLAVGQTVLLVYWIIFEGFEVFDSMRRRTNSGNPSALFPLNAICFTAVSGVQWAEASQGTLYQFFALAAGVYLASSLIRAMILPPTGFPARLSALDRALRGSYEGAATLAATFAAVAIVLKLSGLNMALALMAEAELLFLAGLQLRQAHLRHLATVLFAVANLRLVVYDIPRGGHITVAGSQWLAWSPVAFFEAAVFYLNQFVSNRGAFYSSLAAALLTLALGFEMPSAYIGLAWLLLAVVLFEFGGAWRLRDFTIQSYWVGLAGLFALLIRNVEGTELHTDWHGWLPQLCATVVLYLIAARTRLFVQFLYDTSALMGTVMAAAFLANTLPDAGRAVGWAALGLALLVIGTRLGSFMLRVQSYVLAVITCIWAWGFNLDDQGQVAGLPVSVVTVAAVIASLYAAEFLAPRDATKLEVHARFLFCWLGTLLLAALLFHEVSGRMRTVAWGLQGLGLLFAGFPLRERAMRLAGLVLLLVCVLKLFFWDLRNLEMPFRVLSFLVLGVILIGVSFFYSRFRERISRYM